MRKRSLLCLFAAGTLLAACDRSPTGVNPDVVDCDQVESISLGQTVGGFLSSSDCTLAEDGSLIDYYTFRLSSTRTVSLTLRSDEVDPFLILFDENGDVVDYDDDGDPGSAYGSNLVLTLQPGRYYIGANSAFQGETGSYTLFTD